MDAGKFVVVYTWREGPEIVRFRTSKEMIAHVASLQRIDHNYMADAVRQGRGDSYPRSLFCPFIVSPREIRL